MNMYHKSCCKQRLITLAEFVLSKMKSGIEFFFSFSTKYREYGAIDDVDIDLHIDVTFLDVSVIVQCLIKVE